jgi:hypothetical protein
MGDRYPYNHRSVWYLVRGAIDLDARWAIAIVDKKSDRYEF